MRALHILRQLDPDARLKIPSSFGATRPQELATGALLSGTPQNQALKSLSENGVRGAVALAQIRTAEVYFMSGNPVVSQGDNASSFQGRGRGGAERTRSAPSSGWFCGSFLADLAKLQHLRTASATSRRLFGSGKSSS